MMVRMHYRSFCTLNHSTLAPPQRLRRDVALYGNSAWYKVWVLKMITWNISTNHSSRIFHLPALYLSLAGSIGRAVEGSLAEIVGSNPTGVIDVCCECCVLSGRGLCDELITCPEKSCRLRCVIVCDLETSRISRPWPALGRSATGRNKSIPWYPRW